VELRAERRTFEGTCDELVAQLESARAADKRAEGKTKSAVGLGCLVLAVGAIGSFVLLGLSLERSIPGGIVTIAALTVVLATAAFVRAGLASRGDVDDRKLDTAARFARVIRADLPSASRLRLQLDLRPVDKGGELKEHRREKAFRFLFVMHEKTWKWTHDWFRASGTLADGTRFDVRAGEDVTKREIPVKKKKPGKTKIKTKIKERFQGHVDLALRLGSGRAGLGDAVAKALADIPPPSGMKARRIRGLDRRVVVSVQVPEVRRRGYGLRVDPETEKARLSADHVLQTFLWVYDALGRSGAGAGISPRG